MRPGLRSGCVTLIWAAKTSCYRPALTSLEYISGWLTQNGGVTTATSESNMGNGLLTSPPVSGEVHAATTTAATETTLGSVGASQDKKRRRHEAMDELADGGADVAHVNREA
jgi:hypothetical protein